MNILRAPILFLLLLAVAAFAPSRALAQPDVTATAVVDSGPLYVGAPFTLSVVVDGSRNAETPVLSGVEGFEVEYTGAYDQSTASISIINGRRVDNSIIRIVHQYRLTARRAGDYLIPPIAVTVDGRRLETDPIRVVVAPPGESTDMKLEIAVDKQSLYVGEPTTLRVKWLLRHAELHGYVFTSASSRGAYELVASPASNPSQAARGRDPLIVEFLGERVMASVEQVVHDGVVWQSITFERALVPRESGRVSVGPVTIAVDAVVGRRPGRSFFRDDAEVRRIVAASNELVLDVKPLPTEGRPATFTGLIGEYSVAASATPTSVNVGDPITLTVRVTGPAAIDLVNDVAFDRQPGLAENFRLATEPPASRWENRTKVFTTTIRARNDAVSAIPPIEIPYFDTAAGEYRIARSFPITLLVRPTREITLDQGFGLGAGRAGAQLESAAGGIAHNYESPDALVDQRFDAREVITSPAWLAALTAPIFLFAAVHLAALRQRRAADTHARRRRRALAEANLALSSAPDSDPAAAAATISRAVSVYIAAKFGRPGAALTHSECAELLRERAPSRVAGAAELLARCDSVRFAGLSTTGARQLIEDAKRLLADLESDLGRKS